MDRKLTLVVAAGVSLLALVMAFKFGSFGTTATFVKGMKVINTYGMPGHGPVPAVNETLKAGEAAYVDAVFDPAAHGPAGLGPTQRVVTIESDTGRPVELHFAANVTP